MEARARRGGNQGRLHRGRGIYLFYLRVKSLSSSATNSICLMGRQNGPETSLAMGRKSDCKEGFPRTNFGSVASAALPTSSRTGPIMTELWCWDPVDQGHARASLPVYPGGRVQRCSFSLTVSLSLGLKFFLLIALLSSALDSLFFLSSPFLSHFLPGVEHFLLFGV